MVRCLSHLLFSGSSEMSPPGEGGAHRSTLISLSKLFMNLKLVHSKKFKNKKWTQSPEGRWVFPTHHSGLHPGGQGHRRGSAEPLRVVEVGVWMSCTSAKEKGWWTFARN
jgi:hypothetical protein